MVALALVIVNEMLALALVIILAKIANMSQDDYTTAEAARELDVTPGRIRQMCLSSEVESYKRGRDLFITYDSVQAAKNRKTRPGPKPMSNTEISSTPAKPKKTVAENPRRQPNQLQTTKGRS